MQHRVMLGSAKTEPAAFSNMSVWMKIYACAQPLHFYFPYEKNIRELFFFKYIDGLVQERLNSSALAM